MRKLAGFFVAMFAVVSMFLGAAVLTPDAHAVLPNEIKCWTECWGSHLVECCKYSAKGTGSWTACEDTGYLCAIY